MIFLDWAATRQPDVEVLEKATHVAITYYGNPSSAHAAGRDAKKILNESRTTLADTLSCRNDEIIFTSSGTESNNMVMFSLLKKQRCHPRSDKRPKVIISGIEHPSIYESAVSLKQFGFHIVIIPTKSDGFVDPNRVGNEIDENTELVVLIHTQNETGAVQPVSEVASCIHHFSKTHGQKILFHTDAVQSFGKIPFNPSAIGVDSTSISGHKLGAPRGIGTLFVRDDTLTDFLYCGGNQEKQRRPGTENVPGAFGLAYAAKKVFDNIEQNHSQAKHRMKLLLHELFSIGGVHIIPSSRIEQQTNSFSPYILCVAFPPIPGEVLVRVLEDDGILVSTGSACSSRAKKRTRVLEKMGISPHIAQSAIRISQGNKTTLEEIDQLISTLKKRVPHLSRIAR